MANRFEVKEVDPPTTSAVAPWYPGADLTDTFSIELSDGATASPLQLAEFVFATQPRWISALLRVRDAVVSPFGIKTSRQLLQGKASSEAPHVGIFRVYASSGSEAVLGEDDRHLDFRVSVLRRARTQAGREAQSQLVVTTVVRCHNRFGRLYIAAIRGAHRRVVVSSLQHAAQRGWPAA